MVPAGPDGRFTDEAVRGALVWHTVQAETPNWILQHPQLQPRLVYRFCSIHDLETMRGNEAKAVQVAQTVTRLLEQRRSPELIGGYWKSQAASATVHGRSDSAFIPATLDFMALANDFHPLIQKIVRTPQNYHDMDRLVAALGAERGEVDNTQRAPTLGCFVVPGPLAVDPSEFNENSQRVREVVVFRSLLPYLAAWADNPF